MTLIKKPPAFCHTFDLEGTITLIEADTIQSFLNWMVGKDTTLLGFEVVGQYREILQVKEIEFLKEIKAKTIVKTVISMYISEASYFAGSGLFIPTEEILNWGVDSKDVFKYLEADFEIGYGSAGVRLIQKYSFKKE